MVEAFRGPRRSDDEAAGSRGGCGGGCGDGGGGGAGGGSLGVQKGREMTCFEYKTLLKTTSQYTIILNTIQFSEYKT